MKVRYLLLCLLLAGCNSVEKKKDISIEKFFQNYNSIMYKISPDGSQISFLKLWNKHYNIFLKNGKKDLQLTYSDSINISSYEWADSKNIVFTIKPERSPSRLFSILLSDKTIKQLFPDSINAYLINSLPAIKNEILVGANLRDQNIPDVYRYNLQSHTYQTELINPGHYTGYLTDAAGKIRIITKEQDYIKKIYIVNGSYENLKEIVSAGYYEEFIPLAVQKNKNELLALSNLGKDKLNLVTINLDNGDEKTIFGNSYYDIENIFFSQLKDSVLNIEYTGWKKENHPMGNKFRIIDNILKKKFKKYQYDIESYDLTENKFVIKLYNSQNPGKFYLFDYMTKELKFLGVSLPSIEENALVPMEPISFQARDGIVINGYLMRCSVDGSQPFIVVPHGGPWIRDRYVFRGDLQFLVNRGYSILLVNYRGSVGYGKEFWMAGFREWGGKIQDDIADGTQWLINQKLAKQGNIAVYGFSFGGYSAINQIIKYPDLYTAGISYSGPTNLIELMESVPRSDKTLRKILSKMIGDPFKEKAKLIEYSPIFNIDKITLPLFIAAGINDTKINIKDIDRIVKSLTQRNIPNEFFIKEGEGHSFINEKNRIDLYTQIEKFLIKYMSK